jgi:hypothetical protein
MRFSSRKNFLFVRFFLVLFLGLFLLDQSFLQADNSDQSDTCCIKRAVKKKCKHKKLPGVHNLPGADNAPDTEDDDVIIVSTSAELQQALNTDHVVIRCYHFLTNFLF